MIQCPEHGMLAYFMAIRVVEFLSRGCKIGNCPEHGMLAYLLYLDSEIDLGLGWTWSEGIKTKC